MLTLTAYGQDDRFKYSDLVLGGPQIRFYAGTPLIVQGDDGCRYKIGTLCIIDRRPRNLEAFHFPVMESLARLVVGEIDKLRGRPNLMADVIEDFRFNIHVPHDESYALPSERAPSHDCDPLSLADTEAVWRAILAGHQTAPPLHNIPSACSARSPSCGADSPRSSFFSDADEDLWRWSSSGADDSDESGWADRAPARGGRGAHEGGGMDWD